MHRTHWPFVLLGPTAIGACLGIQNGPARLLEGAVLLPLIVVSTVLLTLPTLYVATALSSKAPPAAEVGRAAADALVGAGTLMLGLAPAALFLVASHQATWTGIVIPGVVTMFAGLLALAVTFQRLFGRTLVWRRPVLTYGLWSLLVLGLGARMFAEVAKLAIASRVS